MNDILLKMRNRKLPSSTGKKIYTVTDVESDIVTLTGPGRKQPSRLRCTDIERVYNEAIPGIQLTPTRVDRILRNRQYRDSSTMCALVLAMQDPTRVIHDAGPSRSARKK